MYLFGRCRRMPKEKRKSEGEKLNTLKKLQECSEKNEWRE
jgi:hypothetical protein